MWNHSCRAIWAKSQTSTFASDILTNTFMNSFYESVFRNNTDKSKQNSWADTKSCWILKICRETVWKICSRWSIRGWQSPQHQSDIVSGLLTNTWIRTRLSASTPLNPFIPLSSTDFSIPLHHENEAKTQNEREKKRSCPLSEAALKAIPPYCLGGWSWIRQTGNGSSACAKKQRWHKKT